MDYVHDVIFNILQLKLSISVMETDGRLSHQRNEMVSTGDTAFSLHIRSPDQLKLKVPPKFSNGGGIDGGTPDQLKLKVPKSGQIFIGGGGKV